MLLDNEKNDLSVNHWIARYVESGRMDVVTGYFTIGALAFLSASINERIREFRLVLGDIVSVSTPEERTIDLLNENITVEAALNLGRLAKEAVEFLRQDIVLAKTLEPNFCHAKLYLFRAETDERFNFFISGSSNLTEAGIGLKTTHNVELNIAETGDSNQYKELAQWFDDLWQNEKAHKNKTVLLPDGKKTTLPFKEYLISEIVKLFIKYSPKQIYYKILFELFGLQLLLEKDDPKFNRQVGRLENTVIYSKALYEFQKKGVLSIIKMLQKFDGAILADAVGLGKTWAALAVMKFYQMQGREVLLICPKKLHHNWHRYLKNQSSRFEPDQLEFFIRFHTDLQADRMERYIDRADALFVNEKPKLIVIDESHNLRNNKSQRYKFLVDEILKKNEDVKVLMLSATPINNTLLDIRNQFQLMVRGNPQGFDETLGVRSLDFLFRSAQKSFNEWKELPNPKIGDFIRMLPSVFFKLTDSLTVARTRQMVAKLQPDLKFPEKVPPRKGTISENIFVTPMVIGNFESFEELFDHFPPMLSGYQPAYYVTMPEDPDVLHDEQQRDRFLVKMMYILLVKRLESSWYSFQTTVKKILDHHQNALDKIIAFQAKLADGELELESQLDLFEDDDLRNDVEDFTLGKRRKISLEDIEKSGKLEAYKTDLKTDIDALVLLVSNLGKFEVKIQEEKQRRAQESKDSKLQVLIEKIKQKREYTLNESNNKVLIFTVYHDTAKYLFEQLTARGFANTAMVSGDESKVQGFAGITNNYEHILERFCPYTKLFMEREWSYEPSETASDPLIRFEEWKKWVTREDIKVADSLNNPVDILIATDVLSEGQNLQDCDLVINYDIHWNPVRVIQRMGRIDRIGSPNEYVYGVNFWPSNNIESYLNLKGRVEQRMAAMRLGGAEVHLEFSESFKEMAHDVDFENRLNERMLRLMETTWDDIDVSDQSVGFDDFSLERFRQDLLQELNDREIFYKSMPKGVYSGFVREHPTCLQPGMIALLGYPSRPPKTPDYLYHEYELVYLNHQGEKVVLNQKEVLDALSDHKDLPRVVKDEIDRGDSETIANLVRIITVWLESQTRTEETREDGSVKVQMGSEARDILQKIKSGDRKSLIRIAMNKTIEEQLKPGNYDLIAWVLIQ